LGVRLVDDSLFLLFICSCDNNPLCAHTLRTLPLPPAFFPGGGAAKPGSGPVWGTDIPIPPPIPTTWPPEPYSAETGGGASGSGGDASAAAGAAGAATTTSTIVNADGTVVTISLPAAAAPAKAKLKQIYLVSLPAIEGTLWAETGEELISVSVFAHFVKLITRTKCFECATTSS
jgi:hypothetical protein